MVFTKAELELILSDLIFVDRKFEADSEEENELRKAIIEKIKSDPSHN